MKKFLMCVHWLSIFLINATMLVGFYLYFLQDNPPIKFENIPFLTDKQEYRGGEKMEISVQYCKKRNIQSKMSASFFGGIVYDLPSYETNGILQVGCGTGKYQIEVPKSLPSGMYDLRGINTYQINFLVKRNVEWRTQKFRVIK